MKHLDIRGLVSAFAPAILLAVALVLIGTQPAHAQASETTGSAAANRGMEIALEAERRDDGFADITAAMTMTLRNKHGQESTREMRNHTLEVDGDGDKTVVIFDKPNDVKGTAFLNHTHKVDDDDQWLYLPALKRVKRIASSNKSGPFMGSEFAYEDISSQEIEKYTYTFVREEDVDGVPHFVIERVPVDPKSGYTRQVVSYDQVEYRVQRIDFYDRKNDLLKTLTYHGYAQYTDQFWRADRMEMVNHLTGKSTTLAFADYKFQTGLTDDDFTSSTLRRAR
jgi:outer membrane lipoprotein-sorting protein